MKTLIVAATYPEVKPLLDHLELGVVAEGETLISPDGAIAVLITGTGIFNTAYFMTKQIMKVKPRYCVNAGIAGSFVEQIRIGDVVNVTEEAFGDLGAEDGNSFLTVNELGIGSNTVPKALRIEVGRVEKLKTVRAVTVNKVHGNDASIQIIRDKFDPRIESMEGAAFEFICASENIPCLQLRAISNYIEKRDKSKWQIPVAIKNLNDLLISILPDLR